MTEEKLAIIIPTKSRPDEVTRLLDSVSFQGIKPAQIILVDGGDVSAEKVATQFPSLDVNYTTSPCSLTTQRNIGIKMLKRDITLVAFFDDDVTLEKDTLKNMMKFWKGASADTAGASFNNMSDVYKKATFLEKVFLVNARKPGRILSSGFQSKICSLEKTTRVEWLLGCATVWRKNIFSEFMFDEWFTGYARYEDVDFSYRVSKKYRLFVVADARVKHHNRLEEVDFSFRLGKMQVVNRLYFVKKSIGLSVPLCYWACLGLFINNVIKGILDRNARYINRARGNITGFIESLSKRSA